MPHPARDAAASRSLDRHGQAVTHSTFTQTGTDDYGDPIYSQTDATVAARVRHVQTPQLLRGPDGDEVDVDVEIIVDDGLTVTDVNEGEGRPDEFTADGVDYVVTNAETQDNGLINCRSVRK